MSQRANNPFGQQQMEMVQDNQFLNEQNQEVDDTPYIVAILNNELTSVEAVVEVMQNVFQHDEEMAMSIMMEAHEKGSAPCWFSSRGNCIQKEEEANAYCGIKQGARMENGAVEEGDARPHYFEHLEFEVRIYREGE